MRDERGGGQVAGARAVEHISGRGVFLTPAPPNAREFPKNSVLAHKFNSKFHASAAELGHAPQRDASNLVFVDSQQADPVHLW